MINELNGGFKDELVPKPFLYLKWVTRAFRYKQLKASN